MENVWRCRRYAKADFRSLKMYWTAAVAFCCPKFNCSTIIRHTIKSRIEPVRQTASIYIKMTFDLIKKLTFTEIMLPSIKTIIKPSSYVCYESHPYHLTAAAPSYYSVSSPTNTYNSMIDQTTFSETSNYASNSSILNLDDTFSTETEFNDMMSCDDDPDKMDKLLIASGDSNATDSQRLEAGGSGGITQNGGCIEKDEKKMYPCRLCDKKYSTMTNIYRHVRATHSCFLCSLCMKIFNHEAELKEHISKCPKFDFKKPQCGVCMQYFSNTWSLTRHIKIHVSAGEW